MNEVLFPRTDAGVAVQAVAAVVVLGVALWRSWHRPDLRLLTTTRRHAPEVRG